MNQAIHSEITNFIWGIADDVLRDVYVRGKYRDVILPMTVIRRLDVLLEPTKQDVLDYKEQLLNAGITNLESLLSQKTNQAFYNCSEFTLRKLTSKTKQQQLEADFINYLDGFSKNVQEILDKFKFRNQIDTLVEADILGPLIEKFLDSSINLSPNPILDKDGAIIKPGLDNHAMGTIFEELIRKFNEENNEEAGEHFTPRDVVTLMADLIFDPIVNDIDPGTFIIYDGACGTGGMLTVAENRLKELIRNHKKKPRVHLFGQEINPETYAIAKADLLIKGQGKEAQYIKFGSTLSNDAYPDRTFDFMLSNPPYGKSWKTDFERLGGKKEFKDHRFIIEYGGDPEYRMIPRSSDGQLLFLVNKLTKMKKDTPMGSRIAEVHNGSSLFTGDAGQGESNIRRWIIENDWLEAIIALPENMFYNTGIATYIWVLTNRKDPRKKGKIQLIDASKLFAPMRKNLGKKNCYFTQRHIDQILQLHNRFNETAISKIFPNEAFGYWKVTVDRPLRLRVDLTDPVLARFDTVCAESKEEALASLIRAMRETVGDGPHMDYHSFMASVEQAAAEKAVKLTTKGRKLLQTELAVRDGKAEPVIKKIYPKGKQTTAPLYGRFEQEVKGRTAVVEYEPDSTLRDTEQIPLLEQGGIEAFFKREVLPYVADAWMDQSKILVGYEISFTRHFYEPEPMRSLEEIKADIYALERETDGLLEQIVGEKES